jgi:hypothetical protein
MNKTQLQIQEIAIDKTNSSHLHNIVLRKNKQLEFTSTSEGETAVFRSFSQTPIDQQNNKRTDFES